jgi:hypothetical protein
MQCGEPQAIQSKSCLPLSFACHRIIIVDEACGPWLQSLSGASPTKLTGIEVLNLRADGGCDIQTIESGDVVPRGVPDESAVARARV